MRLLIVGHSHINALSRAYEENGEQADGVRIDFLNFREEKYWKGNVPPRTPEMSKLDALLPDFSSLANAADIVVFCINGNEHNNVGMFEFPSRISGMLRSSSSETLLKITKHGLKGSCHALKSRHSNENLVKIARASIAKSVAGGNTPIPWESAWAS